MQRTALKIALPSGGTVSALLDVPADATAAFVFAHGAGAGMNHWFMEALASALAVRAIATVRFQFPFIDQDSKRPYPPAAAHAAIRAAVAEAASRCPGLALFAGGKSYGGRMTSQAQALEALPKVRGLIFVGFPLHPAGKPAVERAQHLADVALPMLFLQGTRDALAELELLRATTVKLGGLTTLHVVDGADHAFHVLARSGRSDAQVLAEVADTMAGWMTLQA